MSQGKVHPALGGYNEDVPKSVLAAKAGSSVVRTPCGTRSGLYLGSPGC